MKQIDGASGATTKDLANMLNETFLSPISGFVLLPSDFLCSFNESMTTDAVLTVTTESVFEKVSRPRWNTTVVVKRKYGLIA